MSKQKILFFWSNLYAFKNMEYVIQFLSEKYIIDIFLVLDNKNDIYEAELFCLKNSAIDNYNVIYVGNNNIYFDIIIKKGFFELDFQRYKYCIAGDECQPYSKYFLHSVLNKNVKKIVFWIHTSYLIQNLQNIEANRQSSLRPRNKQITKIIKLIKLLLDIFSDLTLNIIKKKIEIIFEKFYIFFKKIIFSYILFPIIKGKYKKYNLYKNKLDILSEVGGGTLNCYLFLDMQDVNLFNKYAKKKIAFQTKHHLSYFDPRQEFSKNSMELETLYLPLSIFDQNKLDKKKYERYCKYIDVISTKYKLKKLVFRKHPRDNNLFLNNILKILDKKYPIIIENSSDPVQKNAYKYKYCLSTVSAAIKDIRALNKDIKIILIEEFSNLLFKQPKDFFEERENISWINEDYRIIERLNIRDNNTKIKSLDYYLN